MAHVQLGRRPDRVGDHVDDGDCLAHDRRHLDRVAGRNTISARVHQEHDSDIACPKALIG